MNFEAFLLESFSNGKYKTPITEDKAIDLIKTHCKKVDIAKPFYRGMKKQSDNYYIFQGDSGSRLSATAKESGNYYNTLLDYYIKEKGSDLPLRGKSIICANTANFNHTEHFGSQRFAVFPYDTTIIGYLPAFDIWHCKLQFADKKIEFLDFNELLTKLGNINSLDVDKMIQSIKDVVSDKHILIGDAANNAAKQLKSFFEDVDKVEDTLKKAFTSVDYFFGDASKDDGQEREVWIGGPCVAIEYHTYLKIENKLR